MLQVDMRRNMLQVDMTVEVILIQFFRVIRVKHIKQMNVFFTRKSMEHISKRKIH